MRMADAEDGFGWRKRMTDADDEPRSAGLLRGLRPQQLGHQAEAGVLRPVPRVEPVARCGPAVVLVGVVVVAAAKRRVKVGRRRLSHRVLAHRAGEIADAVDALVGGYVAHLLRQPLSSQEDAAALPNGNTPLQISVPNLPTGEFTSDTTLGRSSTNWNPGSIRVEVSVGGGDAETRPTNVAIRWFVRY